MQPKGGARQPATSLKVTLAPPAGGERQVQKNAAAGSHGFMTHAIDKLRKILSSLFYSFSAVKMISLSR